MSRLAGFFGVDFNTFAIHTIIIVTMSFLYQKLGLDIQDSSRVSAYYIVHQILNGLGGYSDNGPLEIAGARKLAAIPKIGRGPAMIETLELLASHKIILLKYTDTDYRDKPSELLRRYSIFVTNRYSLELLHAELKWLSEPVNMRSNAPSVDNLVYYNAVTGEGSVNGTPIQLKKSKPSTKLKPKEIFDLLFAYAPDPVPRDRLLATLRLGSTLHGQADRLNDAIGNLRRRLAVNSEVISLNDSAVLNAVAVPVDKLPHSFIFPD